MSNTNTPHYVGETGVELILNCGMNVTHAEVLQILVKKPSGATVIWEAEPYISDKNSLRHITEDGDFNQSGEYIIQAKVKVGGFSGLGTATAFTIFDRA